MEHLTNWITSAHQAELLEYCREHHHLFASAHYKGGRSGGSAYTMACFGDLSWDSMTYTYNKADLPEIPEFIREHALSLGTRAECMLAHYYPAGTNLGQHKDHLEKADVPLISYSLGSTAEFSYSQTRSSVKKMILLRNADVLIMDGEYRRYYHEVVTVRDDDSHLLKSGRLNFTVRQVNT